MTAEKGIYSGNRRTSTYGLKKRNSYSHARIPDDRKRVHLLRREQFKKR